jgi:hypothetical protein
MVQQKVQINLVPKQIDKGPIKEVLDNGLVHQNVKQVHKTLVLQMPRNQSKHC